MKPNVIYILADDMGYGDATCYNPEGKIPTPNIDRIAREGLLFSDAHSTSAVCSPSRYGILTGRYCWRRLNKGIVGMYGNALIPKERMTVANLFQNNGYHTGCVGKWHLGMTWQMGEDGETPDFTKPVLEGPMVNGFDEYFGVDIPNCVPFTFIEGNKVAQQPTAWHTIDTTMDKHVEVQMEGPMAEGWSFEAILPTLTDHACDFIHKNANQDKPYFLYFPLTSPHTPLAVTDEWKGKSGLDSPYADFVMETDGMIGRVLDALDETHTAENTLIIFASDNGCANYINCHHLEEQGHFPSYHWRGYKADGWDGGHKIPFVMRWPQCIKPGSRYDKVVSLGDFMATCADILGDSLPDNAAEDSISFYPVLNGTGDSERNIMIQHSCFGKFAVRKDEWKLILCAGNGGFEGEGNGGYPSDVEAKELGLPQYQLYNLREDPSEQKNLYPENHEKAQELLEILEDYIDRGRSTPGAPQKNDIECIIDPEIGGVPLFDD